METSLGSKPHITQVQAKSSSFIHLINTGSAFFFLKKIITGDLAGFFLRKKKPIDLLISITENKIYENQSKQIKQEALNIKQNSLFIQIN